MKVESEKIKELLSGIEHYLYGIQDAVRCGGDVLDNISDQCNEVRKLMNEWIALNIIQKSNPIIPDTDLPYLKISENALKKNQEDITQNETICIVQSKCYAYVKRTIRERNDLPDIGSTQHELFCYVDNLLFEPSIYKEYAKVYFYSMTKVVDDIVKEILLDRSKNNQLTLL